MLTRSQEWGLLSHSWFREKAFSLSPLTRMFAVDFSYIAFIMLRQFPSIPSLLSVYSWKGVELFKCFPCICWVDHVVSVFILLMWYIILIDFHMLNHPCIVGMNPTSSWCIISSICCWIPILLRMFALMFVRAIGLKFSFLVVSLSREGNGTPLQYSCLENPMDRGAW